MAGLRLRHHPAGTDDDAALDPRQHPEPVASEAGLEAGSDDRVMVAVVDRPLDLDLPHDLGELVQIVVGEGPDERDDGLGIG